MTINIAFGTRVSSTGSPVVDFTSLAPAAGDRIGIIAHSKPSTSIVASITGFTKIGDHASATGVGAGNDVGDTCIEAWEKTSAGNETTVTVTGDASNSFTHAIPYKITTDNPAGLQATQYLESADNSNGNNVFQAVLPSATYNVGDRLLWAAGGPTDAVTGSTVATPSGFTATSSSAPHSNVTADGQDGFMTYQALLKATSALTGTVTVGYTGIVGTTNTYGPFIGLIYKESAGVALTATPTDNEGLTDSVTVSMSHQPQPLDAEGLSDAPGGVLTMVHNVPESEGLSDTPVTSLAHTRATTDTEGLSDSVAVDIVKTVTPTDPEGMTDTPVAVNTMIQPTPENMGLTDTAPPAQVHILVKNEAEGLTDTLVASLGHTRDVVDAEGLNDSSAQVVGHAHIKTDTEGLSDGTLASIGHAKSQADTLGLSDSSQVNAAMAPSPVIDALGMTDSTQMVGNWNHKPVEAMGLTDDAAVSMTSSGGVDITEPLTLSDAASLVVGYVQSVSDTLAGSDTATVGQGHSRSTVDAAGAADSAVVSSGLALPILDAEGLTDSTSVDLDTGIEDAVIDEVLGLTDMVSVTMSVRVAPIDGLGLGDSASVVLDIPLAVSDALGLSDSVVAGLNIRVEAAKTPNARWGIRMGSRPARIVTGTTIQLITPDSTQTRLVTRGGPARFQKG